MLLPDSNFDRDLYLFLHFSFLNSSTRQPSPDEAQLNDIRKRLDEALALGAPPGFKVFLDANSGDDDDDDDSLPIEYRESQRENPAAMYSSKVKESIIAELVHWIRLACFAIDASTRPTMRTTIRNAEAWKIQPDCEYHSVQKSTEEALDEISDHRMGGSALPESLSASIRKTIATVMDFIVDTLNASPAPSNALLDIETVRSKNPPDLVPKPSSLQAGDEMVYACFLWNDEQHSFDEVIDKVMTATRKSRQFAVKVADSVDSVGRDVVSASPSLNRIIYTAKEVSSPARTAHGGLTVSIRAVPDVHREAVAGMALEWFRTVLKRTVGNQTFQDQEFQSVSDFARVCICEELGAPRRPIREIFAGRSYDEAQFSHSDYQPLRLDYFLAFESKLWKSVRNTLKELYISTMIVVGDEFKKTLARRFAQSYLMIAHSYLMKDREWDLSIINLSVQLFTVPTIAAHLVEKTNVVAVLFDLLKTLFMSDAYPEACNLSKFFKAFQTGHSVKLPHYPKLHCERNDIYRTYQYDHVFHDVQYLLGTPQVAASIFRKSNLDGLDAFLDLCCLLQGMNPQQREETVHVAYESLGWIGAFPVSINICNMIDRMLDTFAPTTMENVEADFTHLLTAIRKVNQKLDLWCAHEQQSELMTLLRADPARYENSTAYDTWKHVSFVTGSLVSLPDAMATLWALTLVPKYMVAMRSSALARQFNAAELFVDETPLDAVTTRDEPDSSFQPHIPARDADGANDMEVDIDTTLDISENLTNLAAHDRVLRIMEYPLRVEVLLAQVHSGLWVRNGQAMRDQVHTFANHLLVISGIIISQIRRELIHVLAVNSNGMQFSKIGELIPDRLTRDRPLSSDIVVEDGRPVEFQATSKSLETILKELATFKFPDNASDIGLYELETESSLEAVFTKHAEARLKDVPKDFILTSFVAGEDSQQLKKAYRFRVRPPKVVWVEEPSVFSEMNYMSLKPSFLKIAFFGLYNLTKVEKPIVSDKIMAAIVHLLLYAVENDVLLLEKNSETDTFSAKAVNVIFTVTEERGNFTSSIFDLVLNVLNRYDEENFKDYVDKFTYIASQITKLSKSLADPKIRSWRDNHRLRSEEDNTAAVKEEKARRKEANKKRQAALMAQFENQQKAFMQNFAEDEDFINEKVFKKELRIAMEKEFGAGNCIVCQEEMVVGTKEYGYLSLMQTCQMERARFLNFQDPDHLRALILRGGSLDVEDKSNALTPSGKSPPSTPLKELKRMQSAASVKSGASSSRRDPKAAQYVIPPPYLLLNGPQNFKEYVNWNGSRAGTDDFGSADSKMGQLEMWFKERSPTIEKIIVGEKWRTPTNQGMIGRFMTFFRRRGSITPQSAAPLASPAERRSEGSVRLISGIFSYIFPTLEIITKASKQGSFYDRLLASVTGTVSGIERGARGIASKSSNFRMDHGRNGFKRVDVWRRPVTAEEESLLIKDAFENFVEHTIIYDFEGDFGLEDGFRSLTIFWIIEVMRFWWQLWRVSGSTSSLHLATMVSDMKNPAEDAFKTNSIDEFDHLRAYLNLPDIFEIARWSLMETGADLTRAIVARCLNNLKDKCFLERDSPDLFEKHCLEGSPSIQTDCPSAEA
ncbi:hypothetical protein BC829DRAFT_486244 [Chytridium lagenaria]|nr:hypothetical protein BC829DRAFT_486244 [Chytridium lagenaria]